MERQQAMSTRELAPQKPSVGRIVHYFHGSLPGPFAAVITDVHDAEAGVVELVLLGRGVSPQGVFTISTAEYSASPQLGHWTWPPRA